MDKLYRLYSYRFSLTLRRSHVEALARAGELIARKTETPLMQPAAMLRYLIDDMLRKGVDAVTVPDAWPGVQSFAATPPRKFMRKVDLRLTYWQYSALLELSKARHCSRDVAAQFLVQSLVYRWPALRAELYDWNFDLTRRIPLGA
jgi:hypothetical protein